MTTLHALLLCTLCLAVTTQTACAQRQRPQETNIQKMIDVGISILPADALFARPVGGLERTDATQKMIALTGEPFTRALQVVIKKDTPETNATQLTVDNIAPVRKGETLVATFALRGKKADGKSPAEVMFLFERSTDPWTKSVSQSFTAPKDGKSWRNVSVAFVAAEDYPPGQVMASLRLAFGPQTVEIADLKVVSLGLGKTLDQVQQLAASLNPLGNATVTVDLKKPLQKIEGLGGNYCQARYGETAKIDPVGQYTLDHLQVSVARVGLPLNYWTPEKGVYKEEAQAKAALELMQEMAKRKIPIIATIWEGPLWLLPGKTEQQGRVLSPYRYDDCIEAIVQFLVTARDKYNAPVEYFSFNEADYGVNFKFSATEIVDFLKKAAPRFQAAGLKTKFLVGDTANGASLAAYAAPLLAQKELAPYLGPIAFHSWDALSTGDSAYTAIADLGRKYNKPVWCTEAGHDAQLWQLPNPWPTWDNALRLSAAYARTLRLSGASTMLYWTYQNNYPLLSQNGEDIYPAFQAIKLMEMVFPKGATVVETASGNDALYAVGVIGPNGKGTTVLLVNMGGAGKVTIKGLPATKNARFAALKDGADKAGAIKLTYTRSELQVEMPARSVAAITVD